MNSIEKLQMWLEGKYVSPQEFKDSLQIVLNHFAYKEEKLSQAEDLLSEAHDLMDDVHCYDTETYHAISRYFNGDEE
ncbi:hypothetical protein [Metabacillus fastidiosus]|uniref:hypothetical protein n=1 Tax=Metabacillus fastidiosus TaxID=1458 RepID=UPI003D2B0654